MSEGDNSGIAFSRESDSCWDPLIAPGADKDIRIDRSSRDVTITAALFSDGSHEGDSAVAAHLKSRRIAYETQQRSATPIIERIVKDPALDEQGRLGRIKYELSNLSNEPDEASVRAMQREFPDVTAEVIRKDLTDAFYPARVEVWSEVYGYVYASGQYPPPTHPLSEFLRQRRRVCDMEVGRFRDTGRTRGYQPRFFRVGRTRLVAACPVFPRVQVRSDSYELLSIRQRPLLSCRTPSAASERFRFRF